MTSEEMEIGFAIQYFARAALDRLLVKNLAACRDGQTIRELPISPSERALTLRRRRTLAV